MRLLGCFMWGLLMAVDVLAAEDMNALLRAQTVMITVTRENGGPERGAGVLLCQSDNQVYILTARHVLYGKSTPLRSAPGLSDILRTEIQFYQNLTPPVVESREGAEEVITKQSAGKDRDLMLLTVPVNSRILTRADLGLALGGGESEEAGISEEQRVYAVGYSQRAKRLPVSWDVSEGSLVRREKGAFIHTAPITDGFSGGPLFSLSGSLIGINIETVSRAEFGGSATESYSRAISMKEVLATIDKWLPAACVRSTESLRAEAFSSYRKGMRAVSTKNWAEAEQWMRAALIEWPWEGNTLHLQGMRYSLYLPRYHLGLALFHHENGCGEALREWGRSEVQGAIQSDPRRFGKMKRLAKRCTAVLRRQIQAPSDTGKGAE